MTKKEAEFCELYCECYNAKQAYQQVYQCSDASACSKPYHLLKREDIKRYITEIEKSYFERYRINAERIAKTLADIAFDDEGNKAERLRALDLLQKQLSLQSQTLKVEDITINVKVE